MRKLLLTLLLGLMLLPSTAQITKVSDLPNTATLSGTDLFLITVPGVTNRQIKWTQLQALIGGLSLMNTNQGITLHTNGNVVWFSVDASVTNVFPAVLTNSITGNATTATTATTANALATSATLTAAQVSNAIPATITNNTTGNAATATSVPGWVTNALNTGVITLGQATLTNITGNITLGGLSGISSSLWQNAVIVATNSTATDYKITLPGTIELATNSFCLGQDVWVTNKSKVNIAISYGAWFGTNAAAIYYPKH